MVVYQVQFLFLEPYSLQTEHYKIEYLRIQKIERTKTNFLQVISPSLMLFSAGCPEINLQREKVDTWQTKKVKK